jgi:hypothetical protein
MALSEKKILKIKVDYEVGKLSKTAICKKHSISRPTLRNQAAKNGWKYQKNFQEVSEIIEQKTIGKLIEKETDRAVKITDRFLNDIDAYRELSMHPAMEIKTAINQADEDSTEESKVTVSRDEYDRIFAGAKINKICLEALNVGYTGARKALGMDKDSDIEKALAIKHGDRTGDETTTSIEDRIKAKMKLHGLE